MEASIERYGNVGAEQARTAGESETELAGDAERRERARMRQFGWLVGFLFVFGSLTALPAAIIADSEPMMYAVIACGVVFGGLCWLVRWERYSREIFHVTALIGCVEVSVAIALTDGDAAFFFLYATVLSAYVFRTRLEVAAQLGVVVVALFLPLLYTDDSSDVLQHAAFALPAILIVSGVIRYLAETLEDRERTFHRFAAETLTIAERMRGGRPDRAR